MREKTGFIQSPKLQISVNKKHYSNETSLSCC